MSHWDDIRYFLAVARGRSLRAGAEELGVKHSTVLRRLADLEDRLGVRLFDRLPSGYRMTSAGEDVLHLAERMEAASDELEARVVGRDQRLRGLLRVTLPQVLATHLLMPDFAVFAAQHPEVEIELLPSHELVNLTNREADVAIRVVYDRNALPLNLHGTAGPEVAGGIYLSLDLLASWEAGTVERLRWVVENHIGVPDWAGSTAIAVADGLFRTTDAEAQIMAVRHGLGMATLPCFVGDPDPALSRAPGAPLKAHGTIWLLTQGETRKTGRVRAFTGFMAECLATHAPLLAGKRPAD